MLSIKPLEDLVHSQAYPFEDFGVLDGPDQNNFLGDNFSVLITLKKITHVADLMSYTYADGEENDGAVEVKKSKIDVRSLDQAPHCYYAGRGNAGTFIELRNHPYTFGYNEVISYRLTFSSWVIETRFRRTELLFFASEV